MPPLNKHLDVMERLWDYAYDRVGYFGVNVPIDKCHICDFIGDFQFIQGSFICPKCANRDTNKMSINKRLCGLINSPQ